MKLAGVLALLLGIIFGIIAFSSERSDVENSAQNIKEGFDAINAGDQRSLDRASHEAEERQTSENHEWIGCAVCIIAGIALFASSKSSNDGGAEPTSGIGLRG